MGVTHQDLTVIVPTTGRREQVERLLSEVHHRPLLVVVPRSVEGFQCGDSSAEVIQADSDQPAGLISAGILAAKTSHVVILDDGAKVHSQNGEWLDAALDTLKSKIPDGEGVVALNDCTGDTNSHRFQLISKSFFNHHVRSEKPEYVRYHFDTEIWEKAKRLGKSARCDSSRVELIDKPAPDSNQENKDLDIFYKRMADWVGKTPGVSKKVFVAVPIYWQVDPYFFQSMLQLIQTLTARGMKYNGADQSKVLQGAIRPQFGDSLVSRSRNSLTRQFLESDCTDLLFIDSDLKFEVRDVERIMAHPQDVVGGIYFKKQEGEAAPVINHITGRKPEMTDSGLIEVRYVGTGFMKINRSVFMKMIEAFGPQLAYKLDPDHKITEYDFWRVGVAHFDNDGPNQWPPRYLSEDWYFCEMCKRIGVKVWADRGILPRHSGNALYPLSYQEKQIFGASAPDRSDAVHAAAEGQSPAPAAAP